MIDIDKPMHESIPVVPQINPLLARVEMPGSTFQLPSRGLFYTNNELVDGVEMGEIHVNPMSAYDEILMKSPDQLYSGEAIEKVFSRCIKQVHQPKNLLAKDVDFLLVCLRQVTYGEEMRVVYTHTCEDAKSNEYVINLSDFINSTVRLDPTKIGNNYSVTLENGQVVELRPPKFIDVLKMFQDTEGVNISPEKEFEMSLFVIQSVIKSVDGITDHDQIKEWISSISAGWIRTITDTIEKAGDFGADYTLKTKCKDCGKDVEIQSPINPISFFM